MSVREQSCIFAGEEQSHSMKIKHPSRLPEPPTRRQKLSPEQDSIQRDLQPAQLLTQSGSVREQTQQAGEGILFVAGRSHQQGKRMGPKLGRKPQLAQSTVRDDLQGPQETQRRQRNCTLQPPGLEDSTLVVQSPTNDDHKAHNQEQRFTIPESKG